MDSAKMCEFLASGCLLLLILLGDPTEACSCELSHLQTAYCRADFVIKAKFMSRKKASRFRLHYEIESSKMFKGSEAMQELRFLSTETRNLCGYEHKAPFQGEDYVITGIEIYNDAEIDLCSFIRPWAELSPEQKGGISKNYSKGCSCEIKRCYYKPCSAEFSSQCIWDTTANGADVKNMACLPKPESPGSCSWQSLNSQE